MYSAPRAWRPLLALVPAFAVACSDAATSPGADLVTLERPNAALSTTSLALVSDRAFSSLASSGGDDKGAEGWDPTEHKSPRLTIVSAADAPRSAPNVAQALFPAGLKGGNAPTRAKRSFDIQARTVSVDLWNQLSANWQGPKKAASVLFTFNTGGSKRLAVEAQGVGSAALVPVVSLWGAPDSRAELRPNVVSTATVARGRWQHWRVTVRMNTVGKQDGYVAVALDGTTVLEYQNVAMVGGSDADWFDELDWKPKWGGSGDVVAANMTMRWDHVQLRAAATRVSDTTSPTPAPAPAPAPAPDTTSTPQPAPTVASVVVSPASASAVIGATYQFAATARDGSGATIADAPMTWTSSDPTIASVSSTGLATARKAGLALLIATSGTVCDTAEFSVTSGVTDSPVGPVAPTTGYFVSPTGRSGNSGTASSPWDLATALSGASGRIQAGDTVWIRGGTYPDGGKLTVGGSSAAHVVVSGFPGETAIIKRQFRGNASYVVIQNLVFEGPIDGATNQVYLYDAHHVVFTRNVIRNGDFHAGLSVDESHHMTITYNYIHDNGVDTSHDHGIYFKTTTGDGSVIANNLLVRNAARGLSLHDNSGPGVYDVVVAHNTVVGNGSTGILVNDGDRITLVNNVAINNGDKTNQAQMRVLAGNQNKVYNNLTWHSSGSRTGIENRTSSTMSGNRIGNPLFLSSTDFRLQAGSPAIGLGLTNWTFGLDYAGYARDAAPDAGAYEHR